MDTHTGDVDCRRSVERPSLDGHRPFGRSIPASVYLALSLWIAATRLSPLDGSYGKTAQRQLPNALWDKRHVHAERAVRRLPRLVEEKRRQVPFKILVFAMPAARRGIVAAWIPGSCRGR